MKIHGSTALEAAENLLALRRYQPFRFAGKWFVAVIGDQAHAYAKKSSLLAAMKRNNLSTVEMVEV